MKENIEKRDDMLGTDELASVNGGIMIDGLGVESGLYAMGPFSVYSSPASASGILVTINIDNRVEQLEAPVMGVDGKMYTYVKTQYPNEGTTGYVETSRLIARTKPFLSGGESSAVLLDRTDMPYAITGERATHLLMHQLWRDFTR